MFGRLASVCRGCEGAEPTADERLAIRTLFGFLLFAGAVATILLLQGAGPLVLVFVVALAIGGPLATIAHEAAHAFTAMGLGARVVCVKVGAGPPVVERVAGGTVLSMGCYPVGGHTQFLWPERWRRWRQMVIVLAGPAAGLALGSAFFWAAGALEPVDPGWPQGAPSTVLLALGIPQVLAGAFNLLPARVWAGEPMSEGRHLWALIAWKAAADPVEDAIQDAERLANLGRAAEAADVVRRAVTSSPREARLLSVALHHIAAAEGHAAAMRFYREHEEDMASALATQDARDRAWIPLLQVNIAWSALKAGADGGLDLAERFSETAFEAWPGAPAMIGTRGAVLLAKGELARARDLLTRAIRASPPGADRAGFARELAKLEALSDDDAAAEAFERLADHTMTPAAQYR